jgi:hypothetical protein
LNPKDRDKFVAESESLVKEITCFYVDILKSLSMYWVMMVYTSWTLSATKQNQASLV